MLNIAIDGPGGAGKSTVAKKIAKLLNITYLDTGAMYRAMGWKAISKGVDPNDESSVIPMLEDTTVEIKYADGVQQVFADGVNVSDMIREHKVSKAASDISKIARVREILVAEQRRLAEKMDLVLDGRDITSKVLPNTKHKFFLTASPEIRAQRRYDELTLRGETVSYVQLLNDINERDYNDSHRANSPLVQTPDSIFIDSSHMTVDQVVDFIISKVKEVL